MYLNGDSWCFGVKKRWWLGKHEKHGFFGFFRGLSKSCILSWWLSKLSRWTTLSRTNTRFVSARARARVRARAETHRVFVLGLTTHRNPLGFGLKGSGSCSRSGLKNDPKMGHFGYTLLNHVLEHGPRPYKAIMGLRVSKNDPFWGTGYRGPEILAVGEILILNSYR